MITKTYFQLFKKRLLTISASIISFLMANLLIIISLNAYSQDEIKDEYDKAGITVVASSSVLLTEEIVLDYIYDYDFGRGKLFNNNLEKDLAIFDWTKLLRNDSVFSKLYSREITKFSFATDKQKHIAIAKAYFKRNNIGRKIIEKWYNYQPGKGFNLSLIFDRAHFNATREDMLIARSSKRGEALIKDFGQKLVDKSYILYHDPNFGYLSLFKLQFGAEQRDALYKIWPYENDTPEAVQKKLKEFRAMEIPINHVKSVRINDRQQNFNFYALANNLIFHDESKVIKKITDAYPVRANVGTKDNIQVDDRFFVYENTLNPETKEIKAEKMAVIRVKNVAENNIDKDKTSVFYQVSGKKVTEGMMVEEAKKYGRLTYSLSYQSGGLDGIKLYSYSRIANLLNIPACYIILGGGVSSESYTQSQKEEMQYLQDLNNDNLFLGQVEGGLGKSIYLVRNVELLPSVSIGTEFSFINKLIYSTLYFKPGISLGINLTSGIQIFGKYNYYFTGDLSVSKNIGEPLESKGGTPYTEEFPGRDQGSALEIGIRAGIF